MDSVKNIIKELKEANAQIFVDGENLRIDSGKGTLNDQLKLLIKAHKGDLIAYIKQVRKSELLAIPKVKPESHYPLSSSQRGLWILSQLEDGNRAYNMPGLYIFEGELNRSALEYAFKNLIERHESLRTAFKENEQEEISQFIQSPEAVEFKIVYQDLRATEKQEEKLKKLIQSEHLKSFDLSIGPLLRANLYQVNEHKWIFSCIIHHIISDGWSLDILIKELFLFYNAYTKGEEHPLTPLRIHYKDYAVWQQDQLRQNTLKEHKAYWLKQFEGELPILDLPVDKARPAVKTYNGGIIHKRINSTISKGIKALSQKEEVTLFMGLLASVNTLLYKYTNQEDIIIGSPVAGRGFTDLEDQIGLYVNILALRTQFKGGNSFNEILKNIKEVTLDAYKHQLYPFDELVNVLQLKGDMSRHPLFDVVVVIQDKNPDEINVQQLSGVKVSTYKGEESVISKFDITFNFAETEEGLQVAIEYNSDLYNRETIDRLGNHFILLLEAIISQPSTPVHELEYLSKKEKHKLLVEWSNTKSSYPKSKTIVDLFEEQVITTPEKTAVVFEEAKLSYKELNERSNELADYLRKTYKIQRDDLIGIMLNRSERMIIAILGILKSGGAYVPIDPDYPKQRIDYIIEDSKCKAVIDEEELKKCITGNKFSKKNLKPINKPGDLAYVIYTSGTTGNPKGSLIEHRNVVRLFKTETPLFDFSATDVWTMFHSYSFDFSVWEMYGALLYGGKLVIIPSITAKDPKAYLDVLKKEQVTVLNQTPSAFYSLIREELVRKENDLQLRYVIFGGEALTPGMLKEWRERYPATKLINMYGITETTVHVTYKEIQEEDIEKNSCNIGKPIPTLCCYVLDQNQHILPVGIPGELYVGGEGVARGYLNKKELTDQRFIASPFKKGERLYRSGDKVRVLENGEMEYMGRVDDQVKIRGYRIELDEIKNALLNSGKIEEALVLAREDDKGEKSLVAYVVSKDKLNVSTLRSDLSKMVPSYMLPNHYVQLEHLPLTPNGKIDKRALPSPDSMSMQTGIDYVAPRNTTEKKLVAIWQELLDKEIIGVKDNFFEIGGHSLKAARLASHIYKEFEIKVGLKDLFSNPLLEEQARLIEQSEKTSFITISPVQIQPSYPLSSSQYRLWGLSQFEESNIAYNLSAAYLFEGALNLEALEYSFKTLIERHESLRTVFKEDEQGEVRQFINSPADTGFRIVYQDLRNKKERENKLKTLVQSDFARPFDLVSGPLLRSGIYHTEDRQWIFSCVMHHIISDEWSIGVLIKELLLVYNAHIKGEANSLVPLRIQYKDYAAWQQEQLNRASFNEHKAYWLKQFSGELPVLDLPGDKLRPSVKTYNGGAINKIFSAELSKGIKAFSQAQGGTLFMGLLGAVNVLLYRYTNQEDIIIGSSIAERAHIDLEDQIGFYVNILALRLRFKGEDSFKELFEQAQHVTLGAYEHQLYPFDEMVDELALQKDKSRNPLFDVLVVLHNADVYNNSPVGQTLGDIKVSNYDDSARAFSKFDLAFNFIETEEGLHTHIEYNSDIYNEGTIEQLGEHLERLLGAIVKSPEQPISQLNYLSKKEEEQLLLEFNNTITDYPRDKTLVSLFEEQVEKTPGKMAMVFKDRSLSYKELNEWSNQLADYLRRAYTIRGDDLIGIKLERSDWLIISILGVLKSGGAYVPIDPEYPANRVAYMLEDSNCKVLIDEKELEKFKADQDQYTHKNTLAISTPENLAYVIYTSGSTGQPKGVMIEHGSIVNTIYSQRTIFDIKENEKGLQFASSSFDASVSEIFSILTAGGILYIVDEASKKDPLLLENYIAENKIDVATIPPAYLKLLQTEKLLTLKKLVTAGEPAIIGDANSFSRKGVYYNAYGPTESSICASIFQLNRGGNIASRNVPIGTPIANTQIYIVDNHKKLMPVGVVGEIFIGGAGLARGYLNKPELTAEKFVSNPFKEGERLYKTGDLGRWLPDGHIEFIGRKDDQVKIRGYRIELGEIENALQSYAAIDSAIVTARLNHEKDKELVAYIVSKEAITIADIQAHINEQLPSYMLPDHFVRLDALPLTSNGKVDRKKLPDPEGLSLSSGAAYVPPRNEIEKKLVLIWQELLEREKIGIKDNFFVLGGHSLRAVRLASHIHKAFQIKVELKTLFDKAVLEEQAQLIEQSKKASFSSISPVAVQPDYSLSSGQHQLWIRSQFEESNITYNMSVAFIFEGDLNREALDYSFTRLIERHESLRTIFRENAQEEIKQFIKPPKEVGFNIVYQDLRKERGQEKKLKERMQQEFVKPFDLAAGPLLRAGLYQVEDHKWVFTYVMHHIISDGWSMGVLIHELLLIYNAHIKGEVRPMTPLRIQYKDYAAWQQEQLRGEALKAHKSYWLKQFEGELPVLELPADKVRPAVKTYNGGLVSKRINSRLSKGIKSLSQEQGATLFMGLMASVNTLFYKYTNQEDIILGSSIAGRAHSDLEDQIGFYVNTLALRTRFKGENTYKELLENIKGITLGAYEHQIYPFYELVNALHLQRQMDRHPLFDVMVELHNNKVNTILNDGEIKNFHNLKVKLFDEVEHLISKFDLNFIFEELGEELSLVIEYNNDLFDKTTVLRFADHLEQLMDAIVKQPSHPIRQLEYLSPEEKQKLVVEFNDEANLNVESLFNSSLSKEF